MPSLEDRAESQIYALIKLCRIYDPGSQKFVILLDCDAVNRSQDVHGSRKDTPASSRFTDLRRKASSLFISFHMDWESQAGAVRV